MDRRFARAVAQRRRRCPRLAPGGGNGKGGESDSLLPQAGSVHAARPPFSATSWPVASNCPTTCGPQRTDTLPSKCS